MSTSPIYLLDANVFIEAKNHYYAFDIAPIFWANLIEYAAKGRIQSIDRVKKQLEGYGDALSDWIGDGNMAEAFMDSEQEDVIARYQEIINSVQSDTQLFDAAKATFANDPDGWLVAYAKAKNCIVVTHETPRPAKTRVMIPNICTQFGVTYRNTFQMLRELGIQFR